MKRKIKWLVLLVLAAGFTFGLYFLNGALPIGTGYTAKYICSQVFLAGRNPGQVFEEDIKPSHILFRPIISNVDYAAKTVTAKAFGFAKPQTALYREGCGCTLVVDTDFKTLKKQAENIPPLEIKRSDEPWPLGSRVDLTGLPDSVDREKLNNVLDEALAEPGPDTHRNTFAIVVVLGDRIIGERYAMGFDADTPLLGWSMTKSVTNILAGILVESGKLKLYGPAPVPAWQGAGDPRHGISLDMMLRMSSGLTFEEVYGPFKDATDMFYTSHSFADFAAAKSLAADPDTQWYYSSGTTNIIARLITDQVGGNLAGFHAFARDALFNRIGAHSALIEADASGTFVGSSYMFATARDWARFGLFLKNGGKWQGERFLPWGWMAYSTRPTSKAPQGKYGAQFWLNAGERHAPENRLFPSLPRDLYYCGGYNEQIVAVIPSRDMVVVRLGATLDKSWSRETFIRQILGAVGQ